MMLLSLNATDLTRRATLNAAERGEPVADDYLMAIVAQSWAPMEQRAQALAFIAARTGQPVPETGIEDAVREATVEWLRS